MKKVQCPVCKKEATVAEWERETEEDIQRYNNKKQASIRRFRDRQEGTFFRCPNNKCQQDVFVNADGELEEESAE